MMRKQKWTKPMLAAMCGVMLLSGCGGKKTVESTEAQTEGTEASTEAEQTEAETQAEPEEKKTIDRPAADIQRFTDGTNGSGDSVTYELTYDVLTLTGESQSKFSALSDALDQDTKERQEKMNTAYEDLQKEAAELQADGSEGMGVSISDTMSLRRCDAQVLSVLETDTEYHGGAHGSTVYNGINYDAQTGEKLEITDVISDMDTLLKLLSKKLCTDYPDITFFAEDDESNKSLSREEALWADLQEYYGKDPSGLSFTVDQEGVTFYFSQYSLAAYAYGSQEVTISFAEAPDIFSGRCTAAEGAWALNFENYTPISYTENGQTYRLRVEPTEYENDGYNAVDIYVNDQLALEQKDIFTFSVEPVLIKAENGSFYLWLRMFEYDDYRTMQCYAVSDGKVSSCGSAVSGDIASEADETDAVSQVQLCDPTHFVFERNTDLLGTYSITRYDRVGSDGIPEGLTSYYTCHPWSTLTTKQDLTLEVIEDNAVEPEIGAEAAGYSEVWTMDDDAETETTGGRKLTIPAGTKLTQLRTNGRNYVDCRVDDSDTVVRVQISFPDDNWSQYVDGAAVEDVFDGVVFAG